MASTDSIKLNVVGAPPQGDSSTWGLSKTPSKADSLANVSIHTKAKVDTAKKEDSSMSTLEYLKSSPLYKIFFGGESANEAYKPDTEINKKADSAAFSY